MESREHAGDGLVVPIGDATGAADVYWSTRFNRWVIVHQDGDRLRMKQCADVVLVSVDADSDVSVEPFEEVALASDTERGDFSLWLVPADRIGELPGAQVLYRSDVNAGARSAAVAV